MPKTLLLADDSVTIQKVVAITFDKEDFQVVAVDNGDDALARARELRPDAILADAVMPRRNGYDLCQAVKADPALSHVPVLLLAGTFEAFDEARARAVQADGWIQKPFETQALLAKVRELAGGTAQPAAAPQPRPAAPTAPVTAPAVPAAAPAFQPPPTAAPRPAAPAARPPMPAQAGMPPGFRPPAPPPGFRPPRPGVPPRPPMPGQPGVAPGFRPPMPGAPPRPPAPGPAGAAPGFRPPAPPPSFRPPAPPPATQWTPAARPTWAAPPPAPPAAVPLPDLGARPAPAPFAPLPDPFAAPPRAIAPDAPVPAPAAHVPVRRDPFGLDVEPPAAPAAAVRDDWMDVDIAAEARAAADAAMAAQAAAPAAAVPTVALDELEFSDVSVEPAAQVTAPPAPAPAVAPPAAPPAIDLADLETELEAAPLELAPMHAMVPPPAQVGGHQPEPPVRPSAAVPQGAAAFAPGAAQPAGDGGEALLRQALSQASREVVERIAWEVVPVLAETIIREHVERLVRERQGS